MTGGPDLNHIIAFMNTKPGANFLRNVGRIAAALEKIAAVAEEVLGQMKADMKEWAERDLQKLREEVNLTNPTDATDPEDGKTPR